MVDADRVDPVAEPLCTTMLLSKISIELAHPIRKKATMSNHNSHSSHHHIRPEEPVVTPVAHPSAKHSVPTDSVAKRAYEKFVARGRTHGGDREDWVAAERELTAGEVGKS
jgi:Protein of unknown function (DUF2934)